MRLNDIYESNSQWLKAEDIGKAKPVVTIETAEVVENDYGQGPKKQIVLTFAGKDKKLGLNFTNASRIAELTGSEDFDEWVGVAIKLYVEKVKFQDKLVDAIRIFPELPEAPQEFSGPPKGKAKAKAADASMEPPDDEIGTIDDESIPF